VLATFAPQLWLIVHYLQPLPVGLLFPYSKDDILTKKTEQVAVLTARANRLTKGLTFCEIHRFNKDRLTSITTMLGTLTATHLQVCWVK